MIKKRRNCNNEEVCDLRLSVKCLRDEIGVEINNYSSKGVSLQQYHLLPKFGDGTINYFISEDIEITLSRFQLHKDLLYKPEIAKEILQICFLITGEKIIYIDDIQQIFYENRASYMASIDHFSGYSRILGKKQFKEIRIVVPKTFLINHGFINDYDFKKLTDEKLILPITEELLSILLSIEKKDSVEKANRLYLRAKVFELIALQMELYKKNEVSPTKTNQTKILNILYDVKQFIKTNIHKNITLTDLGDEVGITGPALNKEFIRVFGYSIHDYTTTEKMDQAKLLLENSQKMVYQIAEEVGYKNATHFTAAFKKKTGTTPKQYKKQL
ncbi:transcriptional regulator, AraC family [Cellulophaga algicola DSM 14237]|uniref:Transcriptional regulator, AraC family n=1 Tax=Cellulophaga algicola (strain DSM 14237 / IC166 / ACAM 630) TaxID=688270 RepID=E6XCV2_CELAD|nr:AraC family transcriptional regulator [Cellulophaga algicola]ADV50093.1 transcriptional regulator, AraC family [Cellulophaga algicola DSM 14237]